MGSEKKKGVRVKHVVGGAFGHGLQGGCAQYAPDCLNRHPRNTALCQQQYDSSSSTPLSFFSFPHCLPY